MSIPTNKNNYKLTQRFLVECEDFKQYEVQSVDLQKNHLNLVINPLLDTDLKKLFDDSKEKTITISIIDAEGYKIDELLFVCNLIDYRMFMDYKSTDNMSVNLKYSISSRDF